MMVSTSAFSKYWGQWSQHHLPAAAGTEPAGNNSPLGHWVHRRAEARVPSSVGSMHLLHWHVKDQCSFSIKERSGEPTLMPTYLRSPRKAFFNQSHKRQRKTQWGKLNSYIRLSFLLYERAFWSLFSKYCVLKIGLHYMECGALGPLLCSKYSPIGILLLLLCFLALFRSILSKYSRVFRTTRSLYT